MLVAISAFAQTEDKAAKTKSEAPAAKAEESAADTAESEEEKPAAPDETEESAIESEDETASTETLGEGSAGTGSATLTPPTIGSGATQGSNDMSLTPPKSMELDMSALGQLDPEKELAEGGEVDKTAAKTETKDWTERAMDLLELHGYFRLRPELYHKFRIRHDDYIYNQTGEQQSGDVKNNTSAGANMRFRLEPTLNISENISIKSQFDFLDNVMLGSTPRYWQGYSGIQSSSDPPDTVYVGRVQGWNMGPPAADQAVVVRRVWGEVKTPFGHLRFGRMGDEWGLGMLHNAGNELQSDFGDSVDRILFASKINDWLIMPAFDFPNEGMSASDASGRPFDVSQLDDSYRILAILAYKHEEEEQRAMLKRGDFVINSGIYFPYQWQVMSFENASQSSGTYDPQCDSSQPETTPCLDDADNTGAYDFYKREIWQIAPDFWFQLLYGTLHLELEAALIYGEVGNPSNASTDANTLNPLTLLQWGMVLQIDYGLLSDALRIGAEFGFANGDKDAYGLRAPATYDQQNNPDNDMFTAFSFNPAYDMDLILHHHILGSVAQSLYVKAWVQYDFLKSADRKGRNLGIRADVIYSRAIYEESTINKSANLGVELNAKILYRSKDGFYGGLSYGVLFPLAAFKGDPDAYQDPNGPYNYETDLDIPQTLQGIFGIAF
jgi:uncharacterized protein (TIGR04551 family)